MKIAVLSIYPFPYGMAATNRIASYTKGLVENGVDVDVITIHPAEPYYSSTERLPDEGWYNGVHYIHPSGRYRSSSKIARALALKTGFRFWRGVYQVRKLLKQNRYDAVILSFDEPETLKIYARLAKKYGSKVIFIFDEYPIPIREQNKSEIPENKRQSFMKVLPRLDGYISINKTLAKFYNDMVVKPTLEMSMIVDTTRFDGRKRVRENLLTYMGQILPDKDNIANIINSFNLIRDKYPDYQFHIYGQANPSVDKQLRRQVKSLNLENQVIFKGFAPADEVTDIMARSKVMVSSQPDNSRVRGVLSTKLAEYVAMGTPTLMCDVGENRSYLSDDDCFFVKPDNSDDYAHKLDEILSNYNRALKVAEHGHQTIIKKYSHLAAGKKIKAFIESL